MWLRELINDVRYTLRGIAREPLFSLMVVLTLALGIGANAAMFGIIDRLLLRGPEHVREPERVMRLYSTVVTSWAGEQTGSRVNYRMFTLLRDNTRSLENVAVYSHNDATLGRGDRARKIRIGRASHELFPLLGVSALRGRFWDADEDAPPSGRNVVVLGYRLWQHDFSADPEITGKTVELDGQSFMVIGVAPKGFTGAELERIDAWTPMATGAYGDSKWATSWNMSWLQVIGRLKPGVSPQQAAADAQSAYVGGFDGPSGSMLSDAKLSFAPLRYTGSATEQTETTVSRWLAGVAGVVLLIACANVMNLLLARALRRRREVAVRVVLGINRARLAQLLLTETMLLATFGGLAGLVVAHWGGQFIRIVLLPGVEWAGSPVNLRVLLFTLGATVVTGLTIGLVPMLGLTRRDLSTTLRSGVREGGGRGSPLRLSLSVVQAALSVLLLVGAGLFVISLRNVRNLDLGIEPGRVWAVTFDWPRNPGGTREQRAVEWNQQERFYHTALERVQGIAGIESAALGIGTPFYSAYSRTLRVPGIDSLPKLPGGGPYVIAVTPDYHQTFGTSVLRGRGFNDADRQGAEPVVIINDIMARTLWPREDPLEKCIISGDAENAPCRRVVGIVENARRFSIKEEAAMQYYLPMDQAANMSGAMMLVRPSLGSPPGIDLLRREIMKLDPAIMYVDVKPIQESLDPQLRPWKLGATLFTLFGGLALLIAGIGLYSVVAFLVTQRTQEWGVRMALGAQPGDVIGLILRKGLITVVIGLIIGAAGALVAATFIEPLLFETKARNPAVIAAVCSVLFTIGVAASLVPARRAVRVNPIQALRSD